MSLPICDCGGKIDYWTERGDNPNQYKCRECDAQYPDWKTLRPRLPHVEWFDDWYQNYLPEGWDSILDRFIDRIKNIAPGFRLAQAKEKFADLRLYTGDWGTDDSKIIDAVKRAIDLAELEARFTCQSCGTFAPDVRVRGQGWIVNNCDSCHEDYLERKLQEEKKREDGEDEAVESVG
jgi:hypothetical protein